MTKIAIGADHAGFALKEKIKAYLEQQGYELDDRGTSSTESVDYPDFARSVGEEVAEKQAHFGVLVCGSGIGMAIAANKVRGIRAANVTSENEAQLAREHNNANVLALGARMLENAKALAITDKFLNTDFAGARHQGRVEKISRMEREEIAKERC